MDTFQRALDHIMHVASVPSFSSFEERLHPYVHEVFSHISNAVIHEVPGNNIIYRIKGQGSGSIALTAHLDKINHYGDAAIERLDPRQAPGYLEGAMDDSAGVGMLLALAELSEYRAMPDLLFFFSEMEESKGLKEHPELLKNGGEGYEPGMGARRIANSCIDQGLLPDLVITVDTTPLFNEDPGVALYSRHWEFTDLEADSELKAETEKVVSRFQEIHPEIRLDNNTNDFLHYGYEFNKHTGRTIVSVALEPAIYPYHQKGERVFKKDIEKVLSILIRYLGGDA